MILTATLIGINSIYMFGYLNGVTPVSRKFDHVAMWIAIFAATGLGVVGSVNEDENNPIHSGMRVHPSQSCLPRAAAVVSVVCII